MLVVGSTIGEAVVPVLIGLAMTAGGALVLGYSVVAAIGIIVGIYIVVHLLIVMGWFPRQDSISRGGQQEDCPTNATDNMMESAISQSECISGIHMT